MFNLSFSKEVKLDKWQKYDRNMMQTSPNVSKDKKII